MRGYSEIRAPALVENTPAIDSFSIEDDFVCIMLNGEVKRHISIIDFGDYITIGLKDGKELELYTEEVQLRYAKQRFFICPKCEKRQRFLYFVCREFIFECRTCGYLQYQSRLSNDCFYYYREGMKYAKEKLGFEDPDAYPAMFPAIVPPKPKGMTVKVYEKCISKLKWYQDKYQMLAEETEKKILKQAIKEGFNGW